MRGRGLHAKLNFPAVIRLARVTTTSFHIDLNAVKRNYGLCTDRSYIQSLFTLRTDGWWTGFPSSSTMYVAARGHRVVSALLCRWRPALAGVNNGRQFPAGTISLKSMVRSDSENKQTWRVVTPKTNMVSSDSQNKHGE